MSLLTRAASAVTSALRRKGDAGNLYAPAGIGGWTTAFNFGNRSNGQVTFSEFERLSSNFGVVHVAVNRIAEDISSLKVTVEVATPRSAKKWKADDNHPLALLLDAPCAAFDGHSLRHVLQQHLCLLGRAALLVVDGTHGEPRELHILYPHRLDPAPDPINFISQYRYLSLSGEQQYFLPFDAKPNPRGVSVLETRIPDPTNPYAGSSAVQAGASSITLDAEVRAYGRFYFANNAMPGAVLESGEPFPGVDAALAQKESWNERYQGVYNAGKVAVLWNGLKLRSTAPAFKELDFPNITKATRQDILMHFGVPGPVVGYTDTGALGADTFSAAKAVYQSQTLDPHRKRMERMLNRLAARWGNCRVIIESPVEEDITRIEDRQIKEYENGLLSKDEYREARGYEPDGQPNIWTVPGMSKVLHGLTPEDTNPPPPVAAPDPNALPAEQTPQTKAARYRQMWAEEYRALRDAAPQQRPTLPALFAEKWQAEGDKTAQAAFRMRQAALTASQGDLATAYEALKAEARLLAEV